MKTKKKTTKPVDLNKVIHGGKAQVEQKTKTRGKQKSGVNKKRATFYLSENLIVMIEENCRGNKSFFVEEAVKFYLDKNKH